MKESNKKLHNQSIKIKSRVLLKRILFNSDVSPISFRLKKDAIKKKLKLKPNRINNFIKIINGAYPSITISLLDIGARSGLLSPYIYLTKMRNFNLEGIEPDKEEVNAIMNQPNKYGPYNKMYPVVLSDKIGTSPLYITKMLGCTSIYKPNYERIKGYTKSPYYDIIKKISVPTTTLETLYPNKERFDFIRLDVQGAEFKVLMGGKKMFKEAIGISLEANFCEIYEKQKLFQDMHKLMLENGFRLIILDYSTLDGEITECGDCVYIKDPEEIKTKEDLIKRILFSLLWEKEDYVEFLMRNYGDNFLSQSEKGLFLKKLKIKLKSNASTTHDGISAKNYERGEGYYHQQ